MSFLKFKTRNRILKLFLAGITSSAFSLCEGNLAPRFNAVLNFVLSLSRVKNKYQQTKQGKYYGNHYYSFYFNGVKSKGPKLAPLLPKQRFFAPNFGPPGFQMKVAMHMQC